jgi:hypothetical protein
MGNLFYNTVVLAACGKNFDSRGFWEGHEFTRAATLLKMIRALAPEVCFLPLRDFFRSL